MFISGIDENPDLDLQEMMNRVFDNYPDDFREYWGLDHSTTPAGEDPDRWERNRELDRLAQRVAALAGVLSRPPKLRETDLNAPRELRAAALSARETLQKAIDFVASHAPHDQGLLNALHSVRMLEDAENSFFQACLQLYLAPYLVWPASLADRVVDMTRFAARVTSYRALQYLGRVARCYIYGMTAELAVMSRAALEAVLEDLIPQEQVRQIQRVPKHLRVGLADYIEVAARTALSDAAADSARQLKRMGDDSIHVSAEVVGDPLIVLEHLVTVLKELEQAGKRA